MFGGKRKRRYKRERGRLKKVGDCQRGEGGLVEKIHV